MGALEWVLGEVQHKVLLPDPWPYLVVLGALPVLPRCLLGLSKVATLLEVVVIEVTIVEVVDGKVATLSVAVVKVAILKDGGGKVAVLEA